MRNSAALLVVLVLGFVGPGAAQQLGPALDPLDPQTAWTPPLPCEGLFTDVPCASSSAVWIEQLYRDGVTTGTGPGIFEPTKAVTRQQMAVFLERTMRGATGWPPSTVEVYRVVNTDGTANPTASGTHLLTRLASIPTTGAGVPSVDNPWVVRVGPGLYDLGSGRLDVPAHVTLEGAGPSQTIVTALGGSGEVDATVNLGSAAVLRRIHVISSGSTAFAVAVYTGSSGVLVEDVMLEAFGGSLYSCGMNSSSSGNLSIRDATIEVSGILPTGIKSSGTLRLDDARITVSASTATTAKAINLQYPSESLLRRVEATTILSGTATGVGLYSYSGSFSADSSRFIGGCTGADEGAGIHLDAGGSAEVTNSFIKGWRQVGSATCYGLWNENAAVDLDDVHILATSYSVHSSGATTARTVYIRDSTLFGTLYNGASFTTRVASTEFSSGGTSNAGTLVCAGVWNGPFTFLASSCP